MDLGCLHDQQLLAAVGGNHSDILPEEFVQRTFELIY